MLQPGDRIDGRYTVERLLARGGMATVYVVKHEKLESQHALKVLDIGTPDIRRRLIQEGRVQASLRHPNIVAVTDTLEIDGQPSLIMEYVDGPSLATYLRDGKLELARAERWFLQIVAAVGYAHARGLVHRDLKPDNVLLAPMSGDALPKVTDFGIAKVLEEAGGVQPQGNLTRTGIALGTPSYMPPEQVSSTRSVDHRADVFALGCILYEMVTGKQAYEGDSLLGVFNAIAEGEYTPPEQLVPDLPPRVIEAIRGCLEPDPRHRIQDCDALIRVFREGEPAPKPSKRRKKGGGRGLWLAAGLGAGGLAFALVVGLGVVGLGGAAGAWWYLRGGVPAHSDDTAAVAVTTPPPVPTPTPVPVAAPGVPPAPVPSVAPVPTVPGVPRPVVAPAPVEAPAPFVATSPVPRGGTFKRGQTGHVLGYDVTVHGVRSETFVRQGVMKHAAESGEVLLLVDVTVTNTTTGELDAFFPANVLGADGTEYDQTLSCELGLAQALDTSSSWEAGESRRGEACFEVPEGQGGFTFRFKPEMMSDDAVRVAL